MSDALADLKTEAEYLGGAMYIADDLERYPVSPGDLTNANHQVILGAMLAVRARGEEVHHLSVRTELQRQGRLAAVGDVHLASIVSQGLGSAVSSPRATSQRIRELAAARRLRSAAQHAQALAVEQRLAEARAVMQAAATAETGLDEDPVVSLRECMVSAADEWQAVARGEGTGVDLGLFSADRALVGIMGGDTVIVAARPGIGKTSLVHRGMLDMARRGVPCGFVSVEDGQRDFGSKSIGELGGVNPQVFWSKPYTASDGRKVGPSDDDWARVMRAANVNADLPIRFARIRSCSIDGVVSRMAVMARTYGCKVIAVDYIQRIIAPGSASSIRERTNDVLASLVSTARLLDVVLVLVSQLKRPDGASAFKEPTETDLKESGALEEVAQGLVLLWRTTDDRNAPGYGLIKGKVAKVKRGESGQRFCITRRNGSLVEVDLRDDDAP